MRGTVHIAIVVGGLGLVVDGTLGCGSTERLLEVRRTGNETAARADLMSIAMAQFAYARTCGGGHYAPTLADLSRPPHPDSITTLSEHRTDDVTAKRMGYVFTIGSSAGPVAEAAASCNGVPAGTLVSGFFATATPESPDMGSKAFAVNTDGAVWEAAQQTPIQVTNTGQPAGTAEGR